MNSPLAQLIDANRSMIIPWPNAVLNSMCSPVPDHDFGTQYLHDQVQSMIQLVKMDHGIVGISAPQLGVLRRIYVVQAGRDIEPMAFINPEVRHTGSQEWGLEGCLSLPGVRVRVARFKAVLFRGVDWEGNPVQGRSATEREARVIQHEHDHIDGILAYNRATGRERLDALQALASGGVYDAAAHVG